MLNYFSSEICEAMKWETGDRNG